MPAMAETGPDQNMPAREPQHELIIFLAISIAFVVLGILVGALTGSEPAVPTTPVVTPSPVITAEGPA